MTNINMGEALEFAEILLIFMMYAVCGDFPRDGLYVGKVL